MRKSIFEWAFNFIVMIFATSTIAQPFVIPSASMESTLMTGDHVLVDKLAYAPATRWSSHLLPYEPIQDGDIAVFRYPVEPKQNFVKRVMGAPGDRIHLDHGAVWRNGAKLDEKYTQYVLPPNPYSDNFPNFPPRPGEIFPQAVLMLSTCVQNGELVVPPGYYFMMGDNRENSSDSRNWGLVPAENVMGKPVLVWWSYEASETELTDMVNGHHILDVATHFFTKTRWNRTMRVVRSAS